MVKPLYSVFKYVLLLATGILLLWLAFRGIDVRSTLEEMAGADIFWLSVSISASLVAFLSRAYRWNLLIEPLGYSPRFRNTSYSLMVGYLANLALPRLGEVTRCGSLNRAEKIPFDLLLGTVIVERALDVICLLLCISATAVLEYERLGNFLNDNFFHPASLKITSFLHSPVAITVSALAILLIIFFLTRKKRSGTAHGPLHKILGLLKGVLEGLRSVRKLQKPWTFVFHTILIWFMYFLMSYTCFFALEATAGLSWQAGLFVLVVGGMGMSAPVQGGIGAYHLLVSQGLMLYGISHEHGLAFATLMHTSQTVVVLILGGISFLLLALAQQKRSYEYTGNRPQ